PAVTQSRRPVRRRRVLVGVQLVGPPGGEQRQHGSTIARPPGASRRLRVLVAALLRDCGRPCGLPFDTPAWWPCPSTAVPQLTPRRDHPMNTVQLIGRLTRDPELRFTPAGTATCTIRLAVPPPTYAEGEEPF